LNSIDIRGVSCGSANRQQPLRQLHPVARAYGQQIVVEIIAGVVQHARPDAMAKIPMTPVAVADERIATRLGLQHEGKIFRAQRRVCFGVDIFLAHHGTHDFDANGCLFGMVDGGRYECRVNNVPESALETTVNGALKVYQS